ncbi:nucleoside 2-deoxyribosyltransferase [Chloroflexota bacterium]
MKVYFSGSISGGRAKEEAYLVIVESLEEQGCNVLSQHVARPELLAASRADPAELTYTQDMGWLAESQAVVAEVTTPSLGVGYEICHALAIGKPVLCLYEEGAGLSKMILGNTQPGIVVRSYSDMGSLRAALHAFVTGVGS